MGYKFKFGNEKFERKVTIKKKIKFSKYFYMFIQATILVCMYSVVSESDINLLWERIL